MKIFLTGASGYIGRAIVDAARKRGHHLTGLVRREEAAAALRSGGTAAVLGDFSDVATFIDAAREADAVIFATGVQSAEDAQAESRALDALLPLLSGKAFVYTSGCWVYGDRGDAIVDEEAPLAPTPIVAWRPAHEDRALHADGVRGIVIRPGVVYGDGGGLVGMMQAQGAHGPVQVVGAGNNRWSCVRVDACGELYVLALEHEHARGIFNATAGAGVPYVEIARAASRAGGGDGSVTHLSMADARAAMGPLADALALDQQLSSEKARRDLGWTHSRPTVLEELANVVVP